MCISSQINRFLLVPIAETQSLSNTNAPSAAASGRTYYYAALKHTRFGPLLGMGFLIGYQGFSLIFLGDNPLLENGKQKLLFPKC